MAIRELKTPSAAIDTAGGTFFLAERYGLSPQAISNWRSRGIPGTYRIVTDMTALLAAKGFKPAKSVWAQSSKSRSRRAVA